MAQNFDEKSQINLILNQIWLKWPWTWLDILRIAHLPTCLRAFRISQPTFFHLDRGLSSEYTKGRIFSEKYWYYFYCPKNVLYSILSFVFWIFPPLDTAVQLESADSKQNAISKSLFQDSFLHIFWAMKKKCIILSETKRPLVVLA